eukprot:13978816-Ditylum_brightwellii.AAC.1
MAGMFICLHQKLRCKPELEATVSLAVFAKLNLDKKSGRTVKVMHGQEHWNSNMPAMDKLFYFTHKATIFKKKCEDQLDDAFNTVNYSSDSDNASESENSESGFESDSEESTDSDYSKDKLSSNKMSVGELIIRCWEKLCQIIKGDERNDSLKL